MSVITKEVTVDNIIEIAMGNTTSEILLLAVELDIFDHLDKPLTALQLSRVLNIPVLHLGTILDACCALTLLDKTVSDVKPDLKYGTYQNNDLSRTLLNDEGEHSMKSMVKSGIKLLPTVIDLSFNAIMTGKQTSSVYRLIEKDPSMRKLFHDYMRDISKTVEEMTTVFDLSCYNRVCDLGGSTGQLARKLLLDYPSMKISILDLEQVTKFAILQPENKDTQLEFIVGSFFDKLPPSDLYTMCHVLHNWSDEECDRILSNAYNHLQPGGAVLVLDGVLNDNKVGPLKFNLSGMGQLDGHTGHHRTKTEYTDMLKKNGFKNVRYCKNEGASYYDAIIGTK